MMEKIELRAWEKLRKVIDPGANLNVVDMGLIKELSVRRSSCDAIAKAQSDAKPKHKGSRSTKGNNVTVNAVFRPSSPVCPLAFVLAANIKKALEEVDEVSSVHLKIVDFVRADELNKMMEDA